MPQILSVYRAHPAGIWSRKTEDEQRPEVLAVIDSYDKYLDFKLSSEFRAFKRNWLPQTTASPKPERGPLFALSRKWIEPLIPPVMLRLARRIYHRAT